MNTTSPTIQHGIEIIESPALLQQRMLQARAKGQRIAFVPTMGYLHEGHVSLLRAGRARGDLLVLSIFVNPMQFGASEDLSRYPRDLDGDLAKAATAGTDLAFCPQPEAMYPVGFQTRVEVTEVQKGLCGDYRPGHFAGVATVVLKLINLVQPHVLLLGEKDYQQLQVIRRMVRDLALPVEVLGCPLIRDHDGVARRRATGVVVTDRLVQPVGQAVAGVQPVQSVAQAHFHAALEDPDLLVHHRDARAGLVCHTGPGGKLHFHDLDG